MPKMSQKAMEMSLRMKSRPRRSLHQQSRLSQKSQSLRPNRNFLFLKKTEKVQRKTHTNRRRKKATPHPQPTRTNTQAEPHVIFCLIETKKTTKTNAKNATRFSEGKKSKRTWKGSTPSENHRYRPQKLTPTLLHQRPPPRNY
jgi:hypothetical protein